MDEVTEVHFVICWNHVYFPNGPSYEGDYIKFIIPSDLAFEDVSLFVYSGWEHRHSLDTHEAQCRH